MTAITRKVQIGGYRAEMSLSNDGAFKVAWDTCPSRLTAQQLADYLRERNSLVREMVRELSESGRLADPYRRSVWEVG